MPNSALLPWTTLHSCSLWSVVFPLADMCIEKSLLLFRFAPCGAACQDSDSSKAAEANSALLLRSSSISEGDFQACPSPQGTGLDEATEAKSTGTAQTELVSAQIQNVPAGNSRRGRSGSTENLLPQTGEPASPSTFPRKAPFSRGRLRLLSFRSIEEPRMVPTIKERYPILKHILYFIRDQALTTAR